MSPKGTDVNADPIKRARRQDALLHLGAYCRAADCPARDVQVLVKDYDRKLLPLLQRRGGLHCPVCGSALVLRHVRGQAQEHEARKLEARCSVNAQVWERDRGPFLPAAVLLDARLPPAPAGWFDGEGDRA